MSFNADLEYQKKTHIKNEEFLRDVSCSKWEHCSRIHEFYSATDLKGFQVVGVPSQHLFILMTIPLIYSILIASKSQEVPAIASKTPNSLNN